ncbi:MAG: ABC transporter ATP-binding protein, partial [Alphaproteobacteria bacterium]|nr:ABC transporter ATP-binding protein [Alphaproteobacteria bacterium]
MDRGILIDVRDLSVVFKGRVRAVRGVSFQLRPGEVVALVGESGSGKSTTGLALMGLLERDGGTAVGGAIELRGKDGVVRDLVAMTPRALQSVRGNDIAMIFQEPMSSLNPIYAIGTQIVEAIRAHRDVARAAALADALDALKLLGIPNPERCLVSYPHQLSGGMRQRVMIAMALACRPGLLIAD